MQKDLEIYLEYRRKILAYAYVMNIVSWDSATICPRGSFDYRGQQLEVIGEELYKLRTSDAFCQTIENLYNNSKNLEETLVHEIEVIREEVMQVKKIPMNELLAYEKLLNDVQNIWIDAKKENDFEKFAPYLKKIVDYKRKEAKWLETDSLKGYDVLLNNFEKGYTQKEYDEFFILLKKELVPFIQQVLKKEK